NLTCETVSGKRGRDSTLAKIESCGLVSEVEDRDDAFIAVPAREGEEVAVRREELDLALGKSGMGAPEGEEAPILLEQRRRHAFLRVHCLLLLRRRNRQPRLSRGEAGVRLGVCPNHRRPAPVAAFELRPEADAIRILQVLESKLRLFEA